MNLKEDWKKLSYLFVLIGCIQFVILTIIAMLVYAGGTWVSPYTSGYSFWNNYFSDLGRTKNFLGESNLASFILFTIAACGAGISFIPFFIAYPNLFKEESSLQKWLSYLGSCIGIFSAISFIGIGLTPYDLYFDAHVIFVRLAFSSALFMAIFYSIVILMNKNYQLPYKIIFLWFTVMLLLYVLLLFFGPTNVTAEGSFIQVVGQKIIVYSMIFNLIIQGSYVYKLEIKS